jgi:hypothetical protein
MEAMQSVTDRPRELAIRSRRDGAHQLRLTVEELRCRYLCRKRGATVQSVLHHQTHRCGHGAVDLPFDHRSSRGTTMGGVKFAPGSGLSLHLTFASRSRLMTEGPKSSLEIASAGADPPTRPTIRSPNAKPQSESQAKVHTAALTFAAPAGRVPASKSGIGGTSQLDRKSPQAGDLRLTSDIAFVALPG